MDLKQRLYPMGFRPRRYGPPIFSRANLDPHYWPFRGIGWSIAVHASIFTALVLLPASSGTPHRPRLQDQAIIVNVDELRDVLYLPVLGGGDAARSPKTSSDDRSKAKSAPAAGKAGLSYPGPQPVLSDFPKPTNHTQTVLQPALVNPATLEPPFVLPNIVRLAPPPVESRLKVPDAVSPQAKPATGSPLQLETAMSAPARPLPAPLAESKFKVTDSVNPIAKPTLLAPVVQDVALSAPARPLAAPLAEPRFKLPDPVNPLARPALPLPTTSLEIALAGPARPLAAPLAESRLNVPDSPTPARQASKVPGVPLDLPQSGPARPLAAPLVESKIRVPDAVTPTARLAPAPGMASLDLPAAGQAQRLAAPVVDSKLKVPDSVAPVARATIAPPTSVIATQDLLTLSPTPARRDQPAAIPQGEARGQFAISPQPNLSFPGTEPGTRGSTAGSAAGAADSSLSTGNSVAALVKSPNANTASASAAPGASGNAGSQPGPAADVFPGITILGGIDDSRSRSATTGDPRAVPNPEPLQTSYGITILSSGGSGGGLPDFGVFNTKDQVQTVYLDMRRTVLDSPISWTAEYGIAQAGVTPTNERLTVVALQPEVLLPFPIAKERPVIPAELLKKNPDRMIIAYGVINTEGTMEQLSIKQTPDALLNEIVLNALKKWTFRPARRNGEIVPAKVLLGIPLRSQ